MRGRQLSAALLAGAVVVLLLSLLLILRYRWFIPVESLGPVFEEGELVEEAGTSVLCADTYRLFLTGIALTFVAGALAAIGAWAGRENHRMRWGNSAVVAVAVAVALVWVGWNLFTICGEV